MAGGILGIQILGILFGLFMLYFSFLQFKRKEFKLPEFVFWALLWIAFIVVTTIPEITSPIVKSLSFVRTLDFFIILGFMFLGGMGFYNYVILKKNQNKIETIVRELAIKERKDTKK